MKTKVNTDNFKGCTKVKGQPCSITALGHTSNSSSMCNTQSTSHCVRKFNRTAMDCIWWKRTYL